MTRTNTKRIGRAVLAVALASLALTAASCRRQGGKTVSVVGSTSIQPFAEVLADEFHRVYRDIEIEVQGGGSTAGVQAFMNDIADIGMCSRNLKKGEAPQGRPVVIARDGLAIVVHGSNPVEDLSVDQIRDLFSGRAVNWKQVGGPDRVVRPISREEGSGTREAFEKLVMKKTRISRKALTQESNGSIKELVRHDGGAVGYMSLGLVGTEIKAVRIGGVKPSAENVLNGSYSLVRPFLFIVKKQPRADTQKYLDFVLSDQGQRLLEKEGLVRAK